MRSHAEEAGQLPLRVRAELDHSGVLTYEMPGVDLGAVARGWERDAMSVPAPEPVDDGPSSPLSPPVSVPAEHAGTEAIARELERGALAIVDALKHRAVMHRDEILRLMPGDNTPAKLAKALEEGYVTEDDRGQVRVGPVPVPGPAPVPAKYAGTGSR
jgi:hypothetical protein